MFGTARVVGRLLAVALPLALAGCDDGHWVPLWDVPDAHDDGAPVEALDTPDVGPDVGPDADADADADADDGAADLPPLACDPRFALDPNPAVEGRDLAVAITDATGYAYVDLAVAGPGAPAASWGGVDGTGPYTWRYTVRGMAAGVPSLTFTADSGAVVVATCQLHVLPGTPPPDADADADADDAADDGTVGPPPANRFGIGLVGPGGAGDLDLAADLAGPGGHVKLIFPGVTRDTAGPDPSWTEAVRLAYARDLVPVVRIGPPWGDNDVRNDADAGSNYLRYTALAEAHRRVVAGLPLRDGWPIWIEVHNEPDLCYEWTCSPGTVPGDWIGYEQTAHEYAALLRDVADALHGLGDPRVKVLNGGLAPGAARRCQCGTDGWEGGITALDFLREMVSSSGGVPDLAARLDGFASHSYPAEGAGWGFFVPYDRAATGLRFFESELAALGRGELPVFLTETGWCTPGERCRENGGSRDQVADWTVQAYEGFWLGHASVAAVLPFMLRDGGWNDFAWVAVDGSHYPVYDRVRAARCARIAGRCP